MENSCEKGEFKELSQGQSVKKQAVGVTLWPAAKGRLSCWDRVARRKVTLQEPFRNHWLLLHKMELATERRANDAFR